MDFVSRTRRALSNIGRATRAFVSGGFRGASTGRRMRGWTPDNSGPNALIFANADMLRARSRSLVRENGWAAAAVRSFVANAIGTGIKPQAQPGAKFSTDLQKAWNRWTDEASADGQLDFYGLQTQICRAVMQDGEVFIRLRPRRITDRNAAGRRLTVPLQLQVIEADHVPVDETKDLGDGRRILGGIEFDEIGRRVAYHVYRDHPGEQTFIRSGETTRIPAWQILHIFRPDRPGQLRGQPWLAPAISTLYDIDQYVEASVLRAKLANLLAFFIRRTESNSTVLGEEDQGDGTGIAGIQPGAVHYLEYGEEPVFNEPVVPGTEFQAFIRAMLRSVAAAIGTTYEQLTGDLEGVNYSSIRAGLLEFRRWCEAFQHQVIVYQMCRPVWDAWLEAAAVAGAISVADMDAARDVRWIAPGWPWVDPLKDLSAAKMAVRCGFKSRSGVVSEQGEDAERIDAENASDSQRADSLGLVYDSDGRNDEKGNVGRGEAAGATEEPRDNVDPVGDPKTGTARRLAEKLGEMSPEQLDVVADAIEGVLQ